MKTIQHRKNEINEMGSGMINETVNTHEYLANILKIGEKHKGTLGLNNPPPFLRRNFQNLRGGGY